MRIPEITTPGVGVDWHDPTVGWSIDQTMSQMRDSLFEAAVALSYFEATGARAATPMTQEKWHANQARRREIAAQIEAERGHVLNHDERDQLHWEAEVRFKREMWAGGEIPRELAMKAVFMHAKAFVYAIDEFRRFLGLLEKAEGIPTAVLSAAANFDMQFPHLREVRNTSQHIDDRAQGLGKWGKALDLKPIANGSITAPSGALVLSHLHGNKFGCTMANGELGEIEVSQNSLNAVQATLVRVIYSFPWQGPKRHFPN